jgi:hypothetical protein
MTRRAFLISVVAAVALAVSPTTFGQQADSGGTAAEAKAMLTKAVAAVKADRAKALDEFNTGAGGFKDRDLYVFCAQVSDGKIVAVLANPNAKSLIGTDNRTLKDSTGKPFGEELFAAGQKPEGQITEVTGYLFSRPSDPKPVPKNSLFTRVGDIYCGVGYYK